jgi:glucose/arabinose dehydrogenase
MGRLHLGRVGLVCMAILSTALAGCRTEPRFTVIHVRGGLDHPWDIAFTPGANMVFTERSGRINIIFNGHRRVLGTPSDVHPMSEGGMLGVAIDPHFRQNRRIFTCFLSNRSGSYDIRVVRWRINDAVTGLEQRADILTGIPVSSGRHSGCRPRFGPDGNLWIGTGDAAIGSTPQDPRSLGGKVLRITTGGVGAPGNPRGVFRPQIYNYGHRNVQGIAFSPGGKAYGIEHGPDRDDEINRLLPGGNYGWDPRPPGGGSGYDESVPMTDTAKYPNAIKSTWRSGFPTIAPSGGTFLSGAQWKGWNRTLAVAVLKGEQLRVFAFDQTGRKVAQQWIKVTDHGRLRVGVQGPDGDLYIATDESPGEIFRIHPTG